jgi:GntP family gluconate:H+ symporter
MSVGDTIKTWSVCETIISVVAFLITLAVSYVR